MERSFAMACVFFSLVCFGIIRECGKDVGREEIRTEAIKRGYASYPCDREHGTCDFKWNDEPTGNTKK